MLWCCCGEITFNINIPLFKRSPFGFQNESFCSPKRVLLQCKTSPFGRQKDSF